MKKTIIITFILILSALVGAGVFSFVVAKRLYFPEIKEVANDTGAGLWLNAYQYDPWLWNREKTTIINILDRKNDALNFQDRLEGEVGNVRLIHSGEDFALIAYNDPDFSSMESGYVVHRSPKSESDNKIEEIHIGGNIIAVAPDESGYFYISQNKIFKRSWQGETIMSAVLGMVIYPISDVQLTSVGGRSNSQPVFFFSNDKKMAFWGTSGNWRDGYLFIWDLNSNEIEKISKQEIGEYNNLMVEDDMLHVGRVDSLVSKKLIAK